MYRASQDLTVVATKNLFPIENKGLAEFTPLGRDDSHRPPAGDAMNLLGKPFGPRESVLASIGVLSMDTCQTRRVAREELLLAGATSRVAVYKSTTGKISRDG